MVKQAHTLGYHQAPPRRDESGTYEMVVQPFPGPGPRVQVSSNGGAELIDDVFLPATPPHANYGVSPDGSHLLFLARVDDQRLIIVYNWAAELHDRLRSPGGR